MYKKPLPALSPAETEILRLVWQLEAARVQQMCDALPADRAYATVQTLLRRLEQKGTSSLPIAKPVKGDGQTHALCGALPLRQSLISDN